MSQTDIDIDPLTAIRAACGKPFFDEDGVIIYNADCYDVMRCMPSKCVSLTITSPPYNIGKEYEETMPLEQYKKWTKEWIAEVFRITASTGAFWLNVGYVSMPERAKCIPLPYLLWDIVPFYLIQEVVWNYGAGVAARYSFSPRNEKLLWYVKNSKDYIFNLDSVRDPDVKYPNQKKNGKLKCNPLGKNPTDVWQIAKVTSGRDRQSPERTAHPAQFPAVMIERIIQACSNTDNIIFDPFLGSGTTAQVAHFSGRKVIGCELRKDYCEIAVERIRSAKHKARLEASQQKLFMSI